MELVLPQNYVEIEQEEMMYLDGGGIPRWTVSFAVDAILLATPIGIATAPLKWLGKEAAKSLVKKHASQIAGIAKWALTKAIGGTINLSTSAMTRLLIGNAASFLSVGGAIAFLADYADGNLNRWIG